MGCECAPIPKKQVRQIADCIKTFGFTNPDLIDEPGTILSGHGRVEAAKLLGWKEVPRVRLDHMTKKQKRAYVLADNKLALNAGWDEDHLAAELGALASPEAARKRLHDEYFEQALIYKVD